MTDTPQVVRRLQATALIEGNEFIRKYFHTERLVFATSILQPGQRSGVDPGHAEADEVCYVIEGSVAAIFADANVVHELEAGDAVLIPQSVAHEIMALGSQPALTLWCTAPVMGRDDLAVGGGA